MTRPRTWRYTSKKKRPEAKRKVRPKIARPDNIPEGHKFCTKCRTVKPLDDFPASRNTLDGRHGWCRECNNIASYTWAEAYKAEHGYTRQYAWLVKTGQASIEYMARQQGPYFI